MKVDAYRHLSQGLEQGQWNLFQQLGMGSMSNTHGSNLVVVYNGD